MKKAFITGVTGQDGSYLSEYLIDLGYEVHGMVRKKNTHKDENSRLSKINDNLNFNTHVGDLLEKTTITNLLSDINPDEIYNLGAQSHVGLSFKKPYHTSSVNAMGLLNVLDSYKNVCPDAKFYQASSSEMFGSSFDSDKQQRETTIMRPTSPYGSSKLFGYNIVRNYRKVYGLHATNGILFNHESPRRGSNFVTNKIVKTAVEISLGLKDKLELGNMDSYRDWGHASDYVRAMHKIINHKIADDFVISTNEAHSVREICDIVFKYLNLDYRDYVIQNQKFMRPEEVPYIKGDSTKARTELKWGTTYLFNGIFHEMVDYWFDKLKK